MSIPKKQSNGLRRYGQWAGQPQGVAEDIHRCVMEVWPSLGHVPHQCSRKRGYGSRGNLCKQHANARNQFNDTAADGKEAKE